MSRTTKIVIAILGGAAVGALGVCSIIWNQYSVLFVTAAGLVATAVSLVTGFQITKET